MRKIDLSNEDYYDYGKPKDRTRLRLGVLNTMGLQDFGNADFGVKGVVSGLYIEKVWNMTDPEWESYLEWMQSVIDKKKFLCDSCGEEKTGAKHPIYDENYNLQEGLSMCEGCYAESLGV